MKAQGLLLLAKRLERAYLARPQAESHGVSLTPARQSMELEGIGLALDRAHIEAATSRLKDLQR